MNTPGPFTEHLRKHEALVSRCRDATNRVERLAAAFAAKEPKFHDSDVFVYCAGSLGRGDVGTASDLDLFLVTTKTESTRSRLDEVELLADAILVNRQLGYGQFSNDGEYMKIYSLEEMTKALGAPHDDSENLFTARMLLLLESRCVCGKELYDKAIERIMEHYFRDNVAKRSFRPLFLLNDLLRYWRTLCLNYELIRNDTSRPWRKKNINLKFSRLLTVFGTVLPIIIEPISSKERAIALTGMPPHERFSAGLDHLGDTTLMGDYQIFLNDYEAFLQWKEQMGGATTLNDEELDVRSRQAAQRFSDFVYAALTHQSIDREYRKYLVI